MCFYELIVTLGPTVWLV